MEHVRVHVQDWGSEWTSSGAGRTLAIMALECPFQSSIFFLDSPLHHSNYISSSGSRVRAIKEGTMWQLFLCIYVP